MKTVFIALPFGIEDYDEVACKVAHKAELMLDTYLQLIPDLVRKLVFLLQGGANPIDFLLYSLEYMKQADVVVFAYGWRGDRECSLLHAIALAYELNILDMDKQPKDDGVVQACPFCQSGELSMCKLSRGRGYAMHCNDCGASGSVCDTEQAAIDAWNKGGVKGIEHVG